MFCEICGSEIVGKPGRTLVEGARLIVCQQCSKIGTRLPGFPDKSPGRPVPAASIGPRPTVYTPRTHSVIVKTPEAVEESDLIEEYSSAIRDARAKLGLSQQDLAIKAKEKVTVIQKIEIGKMQPTMRLAKELEHILHVRLLVPRDEIELPKLPPRQIMGPEVTLGDVAVVKHKEDDE